MLDTTTVFIAPVRNNDLRYSNFLIVTPTPIHYRATHIVMNFRIIRAFAITIL